MGGRSNTFNTPGVYEHAHFLKVYIFFNKTSTQFFSAVFQLKLKFHLGNLYLRIVYKFCPFLSRRNYCMIFGTSHMSMVSSRLMFTQHVIEILNLQERINIIQLLEA